MLSFMCISFVGASRDVIVVQMALFLGQKEIERILNMWLHGATLHLLGQGDIAVPAQTVNDVKHNLVAYQPHEAEWREVWHVTDLGFAHQEAFNSVNCTCMYVGPCYEIFNCGRFREATQTGFCRHSRCRILAMIRFFNAGFGRRAY